MGSEVWQPFGLCEHGCGVVQNSKAALALSCLGSLNVTVLQVQWSLFSSDYFSSVFSQPFQPSPGCKMIRRDGNFRTLINHLTSKHEE